MPKIVGTLKKECGRVHWRRLFERKVIICSAVILVLFVAERWYHIHVMGRGSELLTASLLDHIFFGIPIFEE